MSFQNHTTIKKTRKLHWCEHCHLEIPKGSTCEKDAGVFEGDFYSVYAHAECHEEYIRINSEAFDDWLPLDEYEWESGEEGHWANWQAEIKAIYGLSGIKEEVI